MALACVTDGAPQNPPQQAPAPAPGSQASQPALHSVTRLVQVNVIVQDKKGNPVTDLTKDDFEVFDQGKPQTISVFSMEAARILQAPDTPLPPNVYTNRIDMQDSVPASITVILIDALTTRLTDLTNARRELTKYLKQIQPQDRVAIYGLTDQMKVIHEFTNDATSLIAALDRTISPNTPQISASDPDPSNTGDDDLDAFLDYANQQMSDSMTVDRVATTARALRSIADHIARLPGRKNLIWLSAGFPIDFGLDEMDPASMRDARTFNGDIERAARSLNDADVAVYPVDARGLIGLPSLMSASSRGPTLTASPSVAPNSALARNRSAAPARTPADVPQLAPNQKIFDSMNLLAERTGGRAFFNSNDIQGAIRRAIDDSRVTYLLGFNPDHGNWNGKFREIKIKVNRPDTNIRYRRGYFALADEAPADQQKRDAQVGQALNFPLDSSTLGLTVAAKPVDVPGAEVLKVTVSVEAHDVAFRQQGDKITGNVDFYFVQLGDKEKIVYVENRNINAALPSQNYEKLLSSGSVKLPVDVPISPGAKVLRIFARDAGSGSTGSVTIPLLKLFPGLAPN